MSLGPAAGQLGDRPSIHCDGQPLAGLDTAKDVGGVVAQLADRDLV